MTNDSRNAAYGLFTKPSSVNAIFFDSINHGLQIFRPRLIDPRPGRQNEAASLAGCFYELFTLVFHPCRRTRVEQRGGYIAHKAGKIAQYFFGFDFRFFFG